MLSATRTAADIRNGATSAEQAVRACLDAIRAREATVQAWTFLDPEYALTQARERDRARERGEDLGALHGVPVGVKDVFDTADMPTENGTVLHAGRQPARDAFAVSLLRQAGAVILGKTVCTELGLVAPGQTRNPHRPDHTPGGSSSGSAAAVAAGMVPLALGSQNNGSIIRPASYCGVYGFKPTAGRISRTGVLRQSPTLDQLGVVAASLEDVALLAEAVIAFDPADPAMRPRPRPPLREAIATPVSRTPRIAFVRSPVWDQADRGTQEAFGALTARLGAVVREVTLPGEFARAHAIHKAIIEAELATHYAAEYEHGKAQLSRTLCEILERGRQTLAVEYTRALQAAERLSGLLDPLFAEFDAILTPATPGDAPKGLTSTGSPIFCTIWTLCGMPAISLPLLRGAQDLPLGAQLVGKRHTDAALLRTAAWVTDLERSRTRP